MKKDFSVKKHQNEYTCTPEGFRASTNWRIDTERLIQHFLGIRFLFQMSRQVVRLFTKGCAGSEDIRSSLLKRRLEVFLFV